MGIRGFEHGVFSVLENSIKGAAELASKIGNATMEGLASIHDSVTAGIGMLASGSLPSLPSREAAAELAPKIEAPQQQVAMVDPHHVDMHDIGHFAAPNFGSGPAAQGVGRA